MFHYAFIFTCIFLTRPAAADGPLAPRAACAFSAPSAPKAPLSAPPRRVFLFRFWNVLVAALSRSETIGATGIVVWSP